MMHHPEIDVDEKINKTRERDFKTILPTINLVVTVVVLFYALVINRSDRNEQTIEEKFRSHQVSTEKAYDDRYYNKVSGIRLETQYVEIDRKLNKIIEKIEAGK